MLPQMSMRRHRMTERPRLGTRSCTRRYCPIGVPSPRAKHPALITADHPELPDDRFGAQTIAELFGYGRGFGLPSPTDCEGVRRPMNA